MAQTFQIGDIVEGISRGVKGKYEITKVWSCDGVQYVNARRWVKSTAKWSGNSWTYSPEVFKLI